MKTVLTIAVDGNTHLQEEANFDFINQSFRFVRAKESKRIAALEITTHSVPKERWPTLTIVRNETAAATAKPAITVVGNSNAISLADYRDQLMRLEGLIALNDDFRLNYQQISQVWLPETTDEERDIINILRALTSSSPKVEATYVEKDELKKAILSAGHSNDRVNALGHFQMAQFHYNCGHNLDCIRHAYFLFEQLYFPGTFKQDRALAALRNANEFRVAFDQLDNEELKHLNVLSAKWPYQKSTSQFEWFVNFVVGIRGQLQHAQKTKTKQYWSPNFQDRYLMEAAAIMSIAFEVCQLVRLESYGWKDVKLRAEI